MKKRKTKEQKCKTIAKGFGMQRLGSLTFTAKLSSQVEVSWQWLP